MKKFSIIIFVIAITLAIITGCTKDNKEDVNVNIVMPDGAPALLFAEILANEVAFNGYNVNYDIVVPSAGLEAPQIVGAKITNNDADIAVVPINTAANLYNKGADIKVVATVIWGNLYMISNGDVIDDVNPLNGKVVFNISENGTPDLVFKHILQSSGIDYTSSYSEDAQGLPIAQDGKVVLAYKNPQEVIALLKQGKIEYGILGEPAITNALNAIGGTSKVVLDLQEEWKSATGKDESYAQACLVVRGEFLENNKDFVGALIDRISLSKNWLMETEGDSPVNVDDAKAALTANYSNALNNISLDTIARSNFLVVKASDSKVAIVEYLTVIHEFNPNAVGGSLPDDNFYYIEE